MGLKETVQSHNVTNILGYLRKSRQDIEREKRTGEDTLSEQRELMNNVLMNIELPYELRMEIGSGESIDGRPVFQEVLNELKTGKFQAIAVKELSRLSRGNYSDAGTIIELITDNRLVIITPYKVYDPRNPMDMKQIRFELFLAREEYEMIKERMVGARYTYASQGKWVAGKAPFGYSYNKHTQKLQIAPEEAQTVKLIYDLFLHGLNGRKVSYLAIASHLSNVGILTPRGKKNWSVAQVKKILTNELYTGLIKFRTTESTKNGKKIPRPEDEHIYVENAHEPIIDKDTFEEVQKMINNKLPDPRNPLDFSPSELASVCTCVVCGGKLIRRGEKKLYKKQDGTESLYIKELLRCQKGRCMSVKYRSVEKAILHYLETMSELDDKQLTKYVTDMMKKNSENDNLTNVNKQLLEQINHKLKDVANRKEFVFEKYESRFYTDEIFTQRMAALNEEEKKLEKEKEKLNNTINVTDDFVPVEFKKKIKDILQIYTSIDDKEGKNKLLRGIFEFVEVEITEKGKGRIPSKFNITPRLRLQWMRKPQLK